MRFIPFGWLTRAFLLVAAGDAVTLVGNLLLHGVPIPGGFAFALLPAIALRRSAARGLGFVAAWMAVVVSSSIVGTVGVLFYVPKGLAQTAFSVYPASTIWALFSSGILPIATAIWLYLQVVHHVRLTADRSRLARYNWVGFPVGVGLAVFVLSQVASLFNDQDLVSAALATRPTATAAIAVSRTTTRYETRATVLVYSAEEIQFVSVTLPPR